jgi:hypothetical protein
VAAKVAGKAPAKPAPRKPQPVAIDDAPTTDDIDDLGDDLPAF